MFVKILTIISAIAIFVGWIAVVWWAGSWPSRRFLWQTPFYTAKEFDQQFPGRWWLRHLHQICSTLLAAGLFFAPLFLPGHTVGLFASTVLGLGGYCVLIIVVANGVMELLTGLSVGRLSTDMHIGAIIFRRWNPKQYYFAPEVRQVGLYRLLVSGILLFIQWGIGLLFQPYLSVMQFS